MPQPSFPHRSEVRRRDRHKVYAVVDLQDEGRSDSSPPPTIMKESLKGNCSPCATTLPRGERKRCDSNAVSTGGRVGVPVDDRNSSQESPAAAATAAAAVAAANLGSVGPGAEPPVAVASHAFAHEEPQAETLPNRSKSAEQEEEKAWPSFPGDEGVGVLCSTEDVNIREINTRDGTTEPGRRCHGGKEAIAGSRPGSTNTNNEEEAETLPDSFNLSDEYGLEGASTGRNHHDGDDDYDEKVGEPPVFFGLDVESNTSGNKEKRGRGRDRPAAGLYAGTSRGDDDSSSEYEPREKGGEGVYASTSGSDCWPSSSRERRKNHKHTSPPQQLWFGRRTRQNSRRPMLATTRRNSRIVPLEDAGERRAGESEGPRRHRRSSSRNGAQYRSPPPRRQSRGAENDNHRRRARRGVSGQKNRDSRRLALTETESMSGEANYRFEAEMARLRRENEALKQQRQWPTRSSDRGFEAEPWTRRRDSDGHLVSSRRPPQRSSRRHDSIVPSAKHPKRLPRESDAPRAQERQRDRSPAHVSNPADTGIRSARSSSRRRRRGGGSNPGAAPATSWSDFVSRSKPPPPNVGPGAWEGEPSASAAGEVDIGIPRILVEGGFLWKLPYHNAGTPKRRWFQVKPAEGVLTTASGCLVVRPTVAGGGAVAGMGAAVRDGGSARSERGDEGGSGKDPATPMPMMRLRAAWPLAIIWVDPDKDLKRSPPREMLVEEIVDLARGHKTPAFWQQAAHRGIHTLPDPKLCFSLVGHDRTLDLAAETLSEAREWVRALARVTLMVKRGGVAATGSSPSIPSSQVQLEAGDCSDPGEVRTAEPKEQDAEALCSDAVHRQRSDGSAAPLHKDDPTSQQDLSARPEAGGSIPKNTALFGEGRAWSVDTVRAWRRRLFPAVARGDVPAVLALFDQGCPVDLVQTGTGDTPMLLACRLGDIEMARECLRRGSRNDPHPAFGQTALHAAVASGQEGCARLLLEEAAPSRSDALISNHRDPNNETPLHVACRGGYSGIVDALLHHGADMRAVDKRGNTPLHGAAGGGHADALASLLDAGGDGVLEERNARGGRALHAAAAYGHIACVELLLGIAAEPDVPNADGQTPFALASRGGHLAVTGLIRQYAPAAGTPSGGDAQFQALQLRGVNGGSAMADALPRPHASGSTSSSGGTYGHDRESHIPEVPRPAVGDKPVPRSPPLSPSVPVHGSLFDGLQVYVVGGRQPLGSQHASGAAAAAAGGLSARSAHTTTSARTMLLDSHRLSMSSRHYQHQQQPWEQQQQEQPHNGYRSSRRANLASDSMASFSSGTLDPTWRDNILSAPSTVAPSPPMPLQSDRSSMVLTSAMGSAGTPAAGGGDTGCAGVPGSARALARMMHFSGDNNQTVASSADGLGSPLRGSLTRGVVDSLLSASPSRDTNVVVEMAEAGTSSVSLAGGGGGGEGDDDGTPTEAIGSWMTSDDYDQYNSVSGPAASIPTAGQDGGALTQTSHSSAVAGATLSGGVDSPAISGGWVSESEAVAAGRDGVANERAAVGAHSFVVKPSEEWGKRPNAGCCSAPLPGLWRVFESQGYPYYLHEASGHSQWEDPREDQERARSHALLSTMVAADVAAGVEDPDSDRCFEEKQGAAQETGVQMATTAAVQAPPTEMDRGHPTPASPIKPTGVAVAVEVSRYVDTAAAVSQSTENATACCGDEVSKSGRNTEQEAGTGELLATTFAGNPDPTNASDDGSNESDDFGSIDTASLQGGNVSESEDSPLPGVVEVEAPSFLNGDEHSKSGGSSDDSDDGCRRDVGGNTAVPRGREDTDEGARRPPRHQRMSHDKALVPADRADLSAYGARNDRGDERQEQEEVEEEWWQELDDETSGDTKNSSGAVVIPERTKRWMHA